MINKQYVLFTRIPLFKDGAGRVFCDPLWAKDLKLHMDYLNDFSLCCPVVNISHDTDLKNKEDITSYEIKQVFSLRKDGGLQSVIKNFFPNFLEVKKACSNADIAHSGGAGWAFPLSFYLLMLKPFHNFQWVIVIESSFWMLRKNEKTTIRNFIEHYLYSIVLKRCVKSADARIFTQTFYKNYFLKNSDKTLIAPATWVDEEHIINEEALRQKLSFRENKPIEVLFPARLEANKGVNIVFDAIEILSNMTATPLNITLMGQGTLAKECKEFSKKNYGSINVRFQDPVEYGKSFFDYISNFDVVLVSNLAEEQPRIIFDAFSQGCTVIASDTSGIRDITENESNVLLFKRGDAQGLAIRLAELVGNPGRLLELGLEALNSVTNKTHIQMHVDREHFLKSTLKC